MASENTVEIAFGADTSGISDGTDAAAASIAGLGQQATQSFAAMGQAITGLLAPLQTTATAMQANTETITATGARALQAQLATQRALVEQQKTLGDISAEDAIAQLEALAAQEHQINLDRLADQKNIYADAGNLDGIADTNDRLIVENERYNQQIIRLNTQAAKESEAAWDQAFQPISRAFSSSIDGMVRGTQTFSQTVTRMAQNIEAEFANSAAQGVIKWAAAETAKTTANLAGNQARAVADQSGQQTGLIEHIEAAGKHILTDAAEVFGNVFAYLSPDIGPFAAVPAAAASAAVLAVELPSAAGGWVVPSDTMAMVHENEMILPAHLSQGIAGMIAGGQGGGHTFNNTFNVHAGDGVTAKQLPDMIVKTMGKAMRNGQFGPMTSVRQG